MVATAIKLFLVGSLVHDRFMGRRGSDDPPDDAIERGLFDRERAGDRGPHRNLDGDDHAVAGRLYDPAEAAQRDVALRGLRVPGPFDRQQDVLEELLDVAVVPLGGRAAALARGGNLYR